MAKNKDITRVKMLNQVIVGGIGDDVLPGDVFDVSAKVAKSLIAAGDAVDASGEALHQMERPDYEAIEKERAKAAKEAAKEKEPVDEKALTAAVKKAEAAEAKANKLEKAAEKAKTETDKLKTELADLKATVTELAKS